MVPVLLPFPGPGFIPACAGLSRADSWSGPSAPVHPRGRLTRVAGGCYVMGPTNSRAGRRTFASSAGRYRTCSTLRFRVSCASVDAAGRHVPRRPPCRSTGPSGRAAGCPGLPAGTAFPWAAPFGSREEEHAATGRSIATRWNRRVHRPAGSRPVGVCCLAKSPCLAPPKPRSSHARFRPATPRQAARRSTAGRRAQAASGSSVTS